MAGMLLRCRAMDPCKEALKEQLELLLLNPRGLGITGPSCVAHLLLSSCGRVRLSSLKTVLMVCVHKGRRRAIMEPHVSLATLLLLLLQPLLLL